ncbi:MAG TPA: glucose-6-phosphate isomerase [Candidatus Eisenbacteria bacterium]|nr:glucose-6-phosphate isomerase [Candidatus Eisenbacteria bacterium]
MMETTAASKTAWGSYEGSVGEWTAKAVRQSLVKRIWDKDASVWKKEAAVHKEIKNRLGWLNVIAPMKEAAAGFTAFAGEVRAAGFAHVVLLGMGGSSLAPEVMRSVLGRAEGYPELLVLDSTDPGRVADVEKAIDLAKTFFVVSSKSGGTIELVSLFKYFHAKVREAKGDKAGEQFIAITDPGTPLENEARQHGFRRVFLSPEDVGGRFSALTPFGLVPAALIGADLKRLLESAEAMAEQCASQGPENPALALGLGMAVLAEEGRDKLTILGSKALEAFGDWAEQLVAESTGKEGAGIVPVVREPLGKASVYGADRFFVSLSLEGAPDEALEKRLGELEAAGHPSLSLRLRDAYDLGGEFFRWEFATAIACALLKVNAFDQPDVQAAKDRTKGLLKIIESGKELEVRQSAASMEAFWENAEEGDYAAILAFLPDRPAVRKKLAALQADVRNRTKLAVTLGFGPRYLHSTGQLHKGGPNRGIFLLVTAADAPDLAIPGEKYTFGQLEFAQATGDFEALETNGRWLYHARLKDVTEKELSFLADQVGKAVLSGKEHEKELGNY